MTLYTERAVLKAPEPFDREGIREGRLEFWREGGFRQETRYAGPQTGQGDGQE